jgi:hypothetical protein
MRNHTLVSVNVAPIAQKLAKIIRPCQVVCWEDRQFDHAPPIGNDRIFLMLNNKGMLPLLASHQEKRHCGNRGSGFWFASVRGARRRYAVRR